MFDFGGITRGQPLLKPVFSSWNICMSPITVLEIAPANSSFSTLLTPLLLHTCFPFLHPLLSLRSPGGESLGIRRHLGPPIATDWPRIKGFCYTRRNTANINRTHREIASNRTVVIVTRILILLTTSSVCMTSPTTFYSVLLQDSTDPRQSVIIYQPISGTISPAVLFQIPVYTDSSGWQIS